MRDMTHRWITRIAVALIGWIGAHSLTASPANAHDYRYVTIPFQPPNGATVQLYTLEVVPTGSGPFPLAVISHGSPRIATDATTMSPGAYQAVANWFADHGYAVVIPMRRGFGQTSGKMVEGIGPCDKPDYVNAGLTGANDIQGVARYMQTQAFIDPRRVVLVGHSAGGWGSVAAASRSPPGVVAVISFAGGRGSYAPDRVCTESAEIEAARKFGSTTHVPSLWIYSENDHFFGPALARGMFDAYRDAGNVPATFVAAPHCSVDGHQLITRCPGDWHDVVEAFLRQSIGPK